MKQLRVLLLPPGWDASPLQGYPQQYVAGTHLYTWVERDNVGLSFLSKEITPWQGLGLEPLTFRSEVQCTNHYTAAPPISNIVVLIKSNNPIFFFERQSCKQSVQASWSVGGCRERPWHSEKNDFFDWLFTVTLTTLRTGTAGLLQ